MKLYIIGNGFDCAHNLPTKYWDFRTYLELHHPDFLISFEENYEIYQGMNDEQKEKLLWNELESNLANIKENIIIEEAMQIDMRLEGGDIGIEDTLRDYFGKQFNYIKKLELYLKKWVESIKIENIKCLTSEISNCNNDVFVTFNYTSVLETIYQINNANIIHLHGSLSDFDDDPILGHGNRKKIEDIKGRRNHAIIKTDEKESSICYILQDYYHTTYKNISNYMYKLNKLITKKFEEVVVIGHSISGVDLPYFKRIDEITNKKIKWTVYYYKKNENNNMLESLKSQGISVKRINMLHSDKFYDLSSK